MGKLLVRFLVTSFYCRRQTDIKQQALVVQTLDSAIHPVLSSQWITQLVSLFSTCWIVIQVYPVDSAIWTFEQLGLSRDYRLQSLTSIGTASLATISNGLTNCMDSPSWVISTPLKEEKEIKTFSSNKPSSSCRR